jgi:hypothetical protein
LSNRSGKAAERGGTSQQSARFELVVGDGGALDSPPDQIAIQTGGQVAAIEPVGPFPQVAREMLGADPMMGADQPGFDVVEEAVDDREEFAGIGAAVLEAGLEAEIFLYDTLPGGAGFSSQLLDRNVELFQRALSSMKACPENCDSSCYRCLRSFKNKFEHDLLDRHVGAELLEYLLTGEPPAFDAQRVANSTALLCSDLQRQGDARFKLEVPEDFDYSPHSRILATRRDGKRFCVVLSGPLTPDHPANQDAQNLESVSEFAPIVVNELLVRGNLPAATRDVISKIIS